MKRLDSSGDGGGLSPLAIGYMWSVRISSIGIEMGLVAYAGHWLDLRFGTSPILLLLASAFAMVLLFVHLMAIVKNSDSDSADGIGKKN